MNFASQCVGATSFCLTTLVPSLSHAQEFRHLTGGEIRTQVTNGTISDDAHWGEIYERGGRLIVDNLGHPEIGTWRIKGDLLCVLRPQILDACYEVWLAAPKVQMRAPGAKDGLLAFLHPGMKK